LALDLPKRDLLVLDLGARGLYREDLLQTVVIAEWSLGEGHMPKNARAFIKTEVAAIAAFAHALFAMVLTAEAQDATTTALSADATYYEAPSDGGVRRWQVLADGQSNIYAKKSVEAAVVGNAPPGAILSNMGCERVALEFWCKVRPIRGRKTGYMPARYLQPAVGPDGVLPMGVDDSEARARKRQYDAKGTIACAQEQGQSLGSCRIGIARSAGGDATAIVTFPNGFSRRLYFRHGMFISANSTMSGAGRDTDWNVTKGLNAIRVDDQRYEIPNDLIYGN